MKRTPLNTSETISEISAALAIAQGELSDPIKNRTAKAGSFSYSYASLPDLLPDVRAVLSKNGIAIIQECEDVCNTRLIHKSGEWIETVYPIDLGGSQLRGAQARGSAVTYARRYSMMSLLGLAAEDDDAHLSVQKDKPASIKRAPIVKKFEMMNHQQFLKALPAAVGSIKPKIEKTKKPIIEIVDDWLMFEKWGKSEKMTSEKLSRLIGFIESPAGQSKLSSWIDSASSDLLNPVSKS